MYKDELQDPQDRLARNAAIISVATIISRITGFVRSWVMAYALGSTLLSSAYILANNLPNLLYEMVVGGILVTAFLPVYIRVKNESGDQEADTYASNIFTITLILLGIVSLLCTIFSSQVVWTQSFLSSEISEQGSTLASFFFKFFAIQILLYGLSSVLSGILNAKRDFLYSAIAPIFNNLVSITTMFVYVVLVAYDEALASIVLALGTSLGVFAMLVVQFPALKRNGIKLRLHLNMKDPALKETLALGLPALLIMISSSASVSVQNAAAIHVSESGPAIISYARLWYTLPYSFLTVPISTTLFTEFSEYYSAGDIENFKNSVTSGIRQLCFTMIPFTCYLMVFSLPLASVYHVGKFDMDSVYAVSSYLRLLAPALPFYALLVYLNKVFSAARIIGRFSLINLVCSIIYMLLCVAMTTGFGWIPSFGLNGTIYSKWIFHLLVVVALCICLHYSMGQIGFKIVLRSAAYSLFLALLGGAGGYALLHGLTFVFGDYAGSIGRSVTYLGLAGIFSLTLTYGFALALKLEEVSYIQRLLQRIMGKRMRSQA